MRTLSLVLFSFGILAFSSANAQNDSCISLSDLLKFAETGHIEDVYLTRYINEVSDEMWKIIPETPWMKGQLEVRGSLYRIHMSDRYKNVHIYTHETIGRVIQMDLNSSCAPQLLQAIQASSDSIKYEVKTLERPEQRSDRIVETEIKYYHFWIGEFLFEYIYDSHMPKLYVYNAEEYAKLRSAGEGEGYFPNGYYNSRLKAATEIQAENSDREYAYPYYDDCRGDSEDERFRCFQNKIMTQIGEEFEFPVRARVEGRGGRVYVGFVINLEGDITDFSIEKSSGHDDIDAEAVRVVSKLMRLNPGMWNGKPYMMRYTVPINARLR